MKFINIQYAPYLISPSCETMLTYDVLELHEGAFWLTKWPEWIHTCSCQEILLKKNISRSFFYVPGLPPEHQIVAELFNPNTMGKDFLKIYQAMEEAVKSGELDAKAETLFLSDVYGVNLSYLVSPQTLIKWALSKDFDLPLDIQKAIGLYLQG